MINERERGGLLGTSSCFVTLRISRRKWPRKRYTHSRSCPPLLTQCKTDSHLTRFLFQMSAEEWKQALSAAFESILRLVNSQRTNTKVLKTNFWTNGYPRPFTLVPCTMAVCSPSIAVLSCNTSVHSMLFSFFFFCCIERESKAGRDIHPIQWIRFLRTCTRTMPTAISAHPCRSSLVLNMFKLADRSEQTRHLYQSREKRRVQTDRSDGVRQIGGLRVRVR